MAIRLIRVLGRLRPDDAGPYGIVEAKRILDLMRDEGNAVSFDLPNDFAEILTPIFDKFFSPALCADVSADDVCRQVTLERLEELVDGGQDPHWPDGERRSGRQRRRMTEAPATRRTAALAPGATHSLRGI